MVAHPRAPLRPDQLRAVTRLNEPQPLLVELEGEWPRALRLPPCGRDSARGEARRIRVTQVRDAWRIDDEWWRVPISRHYYQLVLADGSLRTVFRDEIADEWYEQRC